MATYRHSRRHPRCSYTFLSQGVEETKTTNERDTTIRTWLSVIATSAFDIEFARMGLLNKEVLTDLTGFYGSVEDIIYVAKLSSFSTIPFLSIFYLCKVLLVTLYIDLFPLFMTKRRIILWAAVAYIIIVYLLSILIFICVCILVQRNWTTNPQEACPASSVTVFFRVSWALNFIGDLITFALPWLIIPGLQLKPKLKIGLYCTFFLGIINISITIVRLIALETTNGYVPFSLVVLWNSLDYNIGLLVAALPSLRPYFRSRRYSQYPTSDAKSALIRQRDAGFTVITDSMHAKPICTTATGVNSANLSYSRENDNLWDDGDRSNHSNIELVNISVEPKA
uniref:Rhodopsin domain-containing protein n=1 Tax=Bionectria ochroleuca TaxID=29856 RepID=A0A8H7K1X5_BIOOC